MTTPLTTFEQAVKLKEVGFDWEVRDFFFKGSKGWVELNQKSATNINGLPPDFYVSRPTLDKAVRC